MFGRIVVTIHEKRTGNRRQEIFRQRALTIGRVVGNDIVFPAANCSKQHARIERCGPRLFLVDLKSSGGTYVAAAGQQGQRVSRFHWLDPADKILISDAETQAALQLDDEPPADGETMQAAATSSDWEALLRAPSAWPLLAARPDLPAALAERLFQEGGRQSLRALAQNIATPERVLRALGQFFPREVEQNAAASLLLLENPAWRERPVIPLSMQEVSPAIVRAPVPPAAPPAPSSAAPVASFVPAAPVAPFAPLEVGQKIRVASPNHLPIRGGRQGSLSVEVQERGHAAQCFGFVVTDLVIGRVPGNHLILPRGNVSKQHARVFFAVDGSLYVEDLRSTNGTYLNQRRIGREPVPIEGGLLLVGDFSILIQAGAPSRARQAVEAEAARQAESGAALLQLVEALGVSEKGLARPQRAYLVKSAEDLLLPLRARWRDAEILAAVAQNPNAPLVLLRYLAERFPREVLANPALPLLLLEDPNVAEIQRLAYDSLDDRTTGL